MSEQKQIITKLFKQKIISKHDKIQIKKIIHNLDSGSIRVSEKKRGKWLTNEWVKKAILLYFRTSDTHTIELGPFEFNDKIPLKKGFKKKEIRQKKST